MTMEDDTDEALEAFRAEARTWLSENAPGDPRPTTHGPEVREYDAAWQRRQFDGGWAGVSWDKEYGGLGLSPLRQVVWYEEVVRSGAPTESVFNVAMGHAGPTLIRCGSAEQRAFHLPRILRGETPWCQGFSEPGAGSDLAGIRTSAVVDGDDLVINGAKIWTSQAQWADYGELLVRTDPHAPRHGGLSWVIMDMHLPGVDIRPILNMDGYPHNCAVFYDDVRVPLTSVVGGVGNGWGVAMETLAAERGPAFLDLRLTRLRSIDLLVRRADHVLPDGHPLRGRMATIRAEAEVLRSMAWYQSSQSGDGPPSAETTAIRTWFVQLQFASSELAVDLLGSAALEMTETTRQWLEDFSAMIAGGTKDIQKNIIGERVLGLPR
ncbi:acyl-CoA dehydrogenase family protein [Oryzobacter telluris]|uniref:acyl-CoA dehydrogenase family protein n=1 Tax=Oryzobacter telluris TaxID=3149179 RepID=UPI00370DCA38